MEPLSLVCSACGQTVYTATDDTYTSDACRKAVQDHRNLNPICVISGLCVKDETRKELIAVLGELIARDGKAKTFDDVLKELLASYKEKRARS